MAIWRYCWKVEALVVKYHYLFYVWNTGSETRRTGTQAAQGYDYIVRRRFCIHYTLYTIVCVPVLAKVGRSIGRQYNQYLYLVLHVILGMVRREYLNASRRLIRYVKKSSRSSSKSLIDLEYIYDMNALG